MTDSGPAGPSSDRAGLDFARSSSGMADSGPAGPDSDRAGLDFARSSSGMADSGPVGPSSGMAGPDSDRTDLDSTDPDLGHSSSVLIVPGFPVWFHPHPDSAKSPLPASSVKSIPPAAPFWNIPGRRHSPSESRISDKN